MSTGTSGVYTVVLSATQSSNVSTEGYQMEPIASSYPPSQPTSLSAPPPAISNPVEKNSPQQQQQQQEQQQKQQQQHIVVVATAESSANLVDEKERPPSYIALSLFNLLCCCFPIGVVAFLYSLEVKKELEDGRYEEARKASNYAKHINYCGLRVGAFLAFFYIIIALIFIGGAIAVATRD